MDWRLSHPHWEGWEGGKKIKKKLVHEIVPRFGLLRSLQSDNGTSFTSKVTQEVSKALGITYYPHCAWRPHAAALQQVGIESGWRTVWEKETRERSFKYGTGALKTSWIKSPVPRSHITYLESWQAESISCASMKSSFSVPGHVSHFIDYFCYFLVQGLTHSWRS